MKTYKGFKIGDKVRHKFRDNKYQNCEIIEIRADRLPLIKVIENGVTSELPYMDIEIK
jgi:hypothetical protein